MSEPRIDRFADTPTVVGDRRLRQAELSSDLGGFETVFEESLHARSGSHERTFSYASDTLSARFEVGSSRLAHDPCSADVVVDGAGAAIPQWPQVVHERRDAKQKHGWKPEHEVLEDELANKQPSEAQSLSCLGYGSDVKHLLAKRLASMGASSRRQ
jgi:hypothetical protein